jgi:hypothetical protein
LISANGEQILDELPMRRHAVLEVSIFGVQVIENPLVGDLGISRIPQPVKGIFQGHAVNAAGMRGLFF